MNPIQPMICPTCGRENNVMLGRLCVCDPKGEAPSKKEKSVMAGIVFGAIMFLIYVGKYTLNDELTLMILLRGAILCAIAGAAFGFLMKRVMGRKPR